MTPKEVIERAVSILTTQLNATNHIPRYTDINKIRNCHFQELNGALQVPNVPDIPEIWTHYFGYQLTLARVIISDYKKLNQKI